jgi:hypothetical protein
MLTPPSGVVACARVPVTALARTLVFRCLHGALPCFDGVLAFMRVRVTAVVRLLVLATYLALH